MPRPVSSMETKKAYPSLACILIGGVEATSQWVVLGPMATGDTLVKIV